MMNMSVISIYSIYVDVENMYRLFYGMVVSVVSQLVSIDIPTLAGYIPGTAHQVQTVPARLLF